MKSPAKETTAAKTQSTKAAPGLPTPCNTKEGTEKMPLPDRIVLLMRNTETGRQPSSLGPLFGCIRCGFDLLFFQSAIVKHNEEHASVSRDSGAASSESPGER